MKKVAMNVCVFAMIVLTMVAPFSVFASFENQAVYDYAGVFSQSESAELEAFSKQNAETAGANIIIVTTDDLGDKTTVRYLEDFYDENAADENGDYASAVLLLLNMTPDNRSVEIQGYGTAETYINNNRVESILDEIVPDLSNGDYFSAMQEYITLSAAYMQEESTDNSEESHSGTDVYESTGSHKLDLKTVLIIELIASLVVGSIVIGIMIYRSGGAVTINKNTYLDQSNSGIVAKSDRYIRTTVTKVARPKSDDSNHGGGGISSGGHSHSGGGRSF